MAECILATKGPKGDQGPAGAKGDAGPANVRVLGQSSLPYSVKSNEIGIFFQGSYLLGYSPQTNNQTIPTNGNYALIISF